MNRQSNFFSSQRRFATGDRDETTTRSTPEFGKARENSGQDYEGTRLGSCARDNGQVPGPYVVHIPIRIHVRSCYPFILVSACEWNQRHFQEVASKDQVHSRYLDLLNVPRQEL